MKNNCFYFVVCAIVYTVGGVLDLLLLNAEMQPWAKIEEPDVNTESKETEK